MNNKSFRCRFPTAAMLSVAFALAACQDNGSPGGVEIPSGAGEETPLPTITVLPASVTEGNEGVRELAFTVQLSAPADASVSVDYATRDGNATANEDYRPAAGTVTLPAGVTKGTIPIIVLGDETPEDEEQLTLQLSNPVNAILGTETVTGTISDDDEEAPLPPESSAQPEISIAPATVAEGNDGSRPLTFRISLNPVPEQAVTVHYETKDGTAIAGSDYQSAAGILTIPAGSTAATVSVPILGDTEAEGDETFLLRLFQPVNAVLATQETIGTIQDDDPPVTESACVPSGNGTDYPVGPGQPYATLAEVPWDQLGPGDTVRIHHRQQPYREKIVLRTSGTETHPIRLCGVPGPGGERPVLDGDGATNDPDDREAYGSYAPMEGLAMVMLWHRDYETKVHHIVIEGLHIRNARNEFRYTRIDGSNAPYENGAACIRIQAGDNIIIRNNELENCGNGIFTMSQGYNEASLTRNLLIEGNYIHGNGQPGSYLEHGVYIQAIGVTYQFNHFGPNAKGADGVTLKERVAGSVIRYNWFDSGSARMLDLVEVEDAAAWYILDEYLRELGCSSAENCPGIDPQRLAKVKEADRLYRSTYVYGNFFNHQGSQTQAANIVHYGSDNDPALSRKGTLYFYNNTVAIRQDRSDVWRFRLFYLGNRDASSPAQERVEMANNIIHFSGENGEPAHFCLDETNRGTIRFERNWVTLAWEEPTALSECYYGNPDAGPRIEGRENLLDTKGAPPPIDPETLVTLDTPLVRGNAVPFSTPYPVTREYIPHLRSKPRGETTTLGAMSLP